MAEPYIINTPVTSAPAGPKGIGGWLVLVAIGQVLGPLRLIGTLAEYYANNDTLVAFGKIPVTMYGELVIYLVYLGITLFTSFVFFAHKRIFKLWFTIEVATVALDAILDYFWVSATTGVSVQALLETQGNLFQAMGATLVGLIWMAYVWCSKRVRNTFVNWLACHPVSPLIYKLCHTTPLLRGFLT
jgi:Protein of unknown function (DUF2569)